MCQKNGTNYLNGRPKDHSYISPRCHTGQLGPSCLCQGKKGSIPMGYLFSTVVRRK